MNIEHRTPNVQHRMKNRVGPVPRTGRMTRSHAPAWECIWYGFVSTQERDNEKRKRGNATGLKQWEEAATKSPNPISPHFMTCTVLHWIPVFTNQETVAILLDSLQFLSRDGMKIHAYIILENHLHLIAQSRQLDKYIARFKSYTAKKLIHYLDKNSVTTILEQLAFYKKAHKTDRAYQFWQEGVHPELITNEEMMRQKVEYIHRNPVERGYVYKPEHWRYSSARNYSGMAGLLEVCKQW